MISGRLDVDLAAVTLIPLVTSDLPIKVAPSSMTSRAAFKSPCSVHLDFSSQRSLTVMLPWTFPKTTIDLVLISPRMSAFSPIVSTPSELISPSTFPSIKSSFWNLMEPLISTSLERMSLPECSAIYFWCSVVDVLGCSLGAVRLVSSDPEINDPSPIEDMGFCGMNFFNTRYYWHSPNRCQRILINVSKFFTTYSQLEIIFPFRFGRRKRGIAAPGWDDGPGFGQGTGWERPGRAVPPSFDPRDRQH